MNAKTEKKTAAENTAPVYRWGTAAIANDKDGAAVAFTAVRYEDGKRGYITAAELTGGKVEKCKNRSYAVVLAVDCAAARGDTVNDKTASDYPSALVAVRRDIMETAARAAERAKEKETAARAALKTAETDAAAVLAKLSAPVAAVEK